MAVVVVAAAAGDDDDGGGEAEGTDRHMSSEQHVSCPFSFSCSGYHSTNS